MRLDDHLGQRPFAPHQQVGHMVASDLIKYPLNPLARGSRPHMESGHPLSMQRCYVATLKPAVERPMRLICRRPAIPCAMALLTISGCHAVTRDVYSASADCVANELALHAFVDQQTNPGKMLDV